MGHFLATRPMTSTDMARTMLKAAGISLLVAWALWAVAFLALFAILLLSHVDPRPQLPNEVGWWYFPITLLGTWMRACAACNAWPDRPPVAACELVLRRPRNHHRGYRVCAFALSPAERH